MRHTQATLLANEPLGSGFFKLTFCWPTDEAPLPGQFLTIRVSDRPFPLSRRPFAFSHFNANTKTASVVIKKRGSATEILAHKTPGELLDIIGPLGNAFRLPPANSLAVIVAGGIGLGPVLFLADRLREQDYATRLVFGCRSAEMLPQNAGLKNLGANICTDDGSQGFRGTAVDCLCSLPELDSSAFELFCCGPLPMLAASAQFAANRGVRCWVAMEQTMGCGMGACMGCVVRTFGTTGYARTCKEGPIFESREIRWT